MTIWIDLSICALNTDNAFIFTVSFQQRFSTCVPAVQQKNSCCKTCTNLTVVRGSYLVLRTSVWLFSSWTMVHIAMRGLSTLSIAQSTRPSPCESMTRTIWFNRNNASEAWCLMLAPPKTSISNSTRLKRYYTTCAVPLVNLSISLEASPLRSIVKQFTLSYGQLGRECYRTVSHLRCVFSYHCSVFEFDRDQYPLDFASLSGSFCRRVQPA